MPFRTKDLLDEWIEEFRALGYPSDVEIIVMPQDGHEGRDTGLVGVRLSNASTITYMQPEAAGAARWVVTMEARDDDVVLDAAGVMRLSVDLSSVSSLCAFLQSKSQHYIDTHPATVGAPPPAVISR